MTTTTPDPRKPSGEMFESGTSRLVLAYGLSLLFFIVAVAVSYTILRDTIDNQKHLTLFNTHIHEVQLSITESIGVLNDYRIEDRKNNPNHRLKHLIGRRAIESMDQLYSINNNLQTSSNLLVDTNVWPEISWIVEEEEGSLQSNLNDYLAQMKDLFTETGDATQDSTPRVPIEAAGARSGSMFLGYQKASAQLQELVTNNSNRVNRVHKLLTAMTIIAILLLSAFVVAPLWLSLSREHRRLGSAHARLYKVAYTDRDTGLPNLDGLEKNLPKLVSATDKETGFYLLLVRIKNLDQIYNLIGSQSVDSLLQSFATRLQNFAICPQHWCRAGETEFAYLLSEQKVENADDWVQTLHVLLTERLMVDGIVVRPEISMAVSRIPMEDMSDANLLWEHASNARLASAEFEPPEVYLPKYHPDMNNLLADQNALIERISIGLSRKEFVPFYQLKVSAQTGEICSIEVLARWRLPDGSYESPGVFIPVAESCGLITEMTFAICEQVITDIQNWCATGTPIGRVAINIARDVLLHNEFIERLQQLRNQIPALCEGLEIEITENIAIGDNFERTCELLSQARDMDIHVAIDDFGTGYASLQTLIDLPFDVLKIDRSFVIPMTESGEGNEVVSAMISLSKALGKSCVVEGVETEWQWNSLAAMGAGELQGFYFHKPSEANTIIDSITIDHDWRSAA